MKNYMIFGLSVLFLAPITRDISQADVASVLPFLFFLLPLFIPVCKWSAVLQARLFLGTPVTWCLSQRHALGAGLPWGQLCYSWLGCGHWERGSSADEQNHPQGKGENCPLKPVLELKCLSSS